MVNCILRLIMKKIFYAIFAITIGCGSNHKTTATTEKTEGRTLADPSKYANSITAGELKEHLYIYASDEFEGRETGTKGQKKAVAYLKNDYSSQGIPAAKSDGDYFQRVPLIKAGVPQAIVAINNKEYIIGDDFVTFSGAGSGKHQENIIAYAGFGIDSEKYSDYKDLDVKGKVVLIKSGEPKNEDGTYLFSNTEKTSKWSDIRASFADRVTIAKDKGAKGLLYYDPESFPLVQQQFNFIKARAKSGHGSMTLKDDDDDFFHYFINEPMAVALYNDINAEGAAKMLKTDLDITVENSAEVINSENVAAIIKGVEKPQEYIVISSHLDHIGITSDGEINNGADDDGSGSVAMLEIAEAFQEAAKNGDGPRRSIIFLHVTGEEKGLLGSRYYTDKAPIFPLENTVANLNIDMIGRIDPKRDGNANYIYLIGSDKLSTDLHKLSEDVNRKYMQLELDYTYNDENDPNRFYYRSDHYNFAKNDIPVIFYFNGTHDDYHRPTDTPDKIAYDLLEKRARLIFHTAWEVANRDKRIAVDKATETAAN